MINLDFHIHSSVSDGTVTPSDIVSMAAGKEGISFIALTDHDTTAGVHEFFDAAERYKGKVYPLAGIEISTDYRGEEIHILGYGIDPDNHHFNERLREFRHSRDERNIRIIEKMQKDGFDISLSDIEHKERQTTVARPDIARALVSKGYADSIKDAFQKYISEDGPYFSKRPLPGYDEVISLIIEAGGTPVLAHILQYEKYFTKEELTHMASTLTKSGILGIETYYSEYDKDDIAFIERLAEKNSLFKTIGSDFHGENKVGLKLFSGRDKNTAPEDIKRSLIKRFFPDYTSET